MNWFAILGISVGLAMDAFAVSIAAGLAVAPVTSGHTFRLAFHFGLFQFLMPVIGWLAGKELAGQISAYDHWVAFGLLALVGLKMLWDSRRAKKSQYSVDPTRGLMLVILSIATSLDALAVGLSMAFMHISIWIPCVMIGLVAAVLSALGITFGSRIGSTYGRWARAAGGCILLFIGVRIVVSHLAG